MCQPTGRNGTSRVPYLVGESDWLAGRNGTSHVPYLVGESGDWLAGRNGTSRVPYLVGESGNDREYIGLFSLTKL